MLYFEASTKTGRTMEDDVQAWSGKTANKIVDEMYSVGILAEENLDTARALAQQQIAETLLRLR